MKIVNARDHQAEEIFAILRNCKYALDAAGIFQWTEDYPAFSDVKRDIENGALYCVSISGRCAGVINISEEQDPAYAEISWKNTDGKILVLHRLAVDPPHWRKGLARKLMDFAESYAVQHKYASIRLDAYSENKRVLRFYENRGYEKRGELFFPGRSAVFFCYEKTMGKNAQKKAVPK